ncbi:MAG: type II secretion system protein [Candidatus Paceibacterota bacterium]
MNKSKGFTLIEMLIVIAIIGLLSSIVIVGLTGAREEARDSRRVAEIRQIQNLLELNYSSNTGYPDSLPASAQTEDPQGKSYIYETTNNGFGYALGICIETDSIKSGTGVTCPSNLGNCSVGSYCVNNQ